QNDRRVVRDAGLAEQSLERSFFDQVAADVVLELGLPVPSHGSRDVTLIVCGRVHVHFHQADLGIARMVRYPLRRNKHFRMRVLRHVDFLLFGYIDRWVLRESHKTKNPPAKSSLAAGQEILSWNRPSRRSACPCQRTRTCDTYNNSSEPGSGGRSSWKEAYTQIAPVGNGGPDSAFTLPRSPLNRL